VRFNLRYPLYGLRRFYTITYEKIMITISEIQRFWRPCAPLNELDPLNTGIQAQNAWGMPRRYSVGTDAIASAVIL
jgi:hypothetical protein